jgi:hypothetical protein
MAGLPVTEHFVQREAEMRQVEKFFGNDVDTEGTRRKVFVVAGRDGQDLALRGVRTAAQGRLQCRLLAGRVVEGRAQAVARWCSGEGGERRAFIDGATVIGQPRR